MLNQGGCIGHADVQPEPCACHLSTQEPSSFHTGAEVLEFGVTLKRWKTSGSFFVDADAGLSEFIETWCTHGGSPAVEVAFPRSDVAGANPYGFSVLLERELGKTLAFADLNFCKGTHGSSQLFGGGKPVVLVEQHSQVEPGCRCPSCQ